MKLIKPPKLNKGDVIATVSSSWGVAGEPDVIWRYNIGKERLENIGLVVVSAPNAMKGEKYLAENPKARAEDIMWAFENKNINAIIANIGGSDSINILPYLNAKTITDNPKIFIGYSDVMNIHLFCYKAGLSTFYGHNLLPVIAEIPSYHPYSSRWFEKVLFRKEHVGIIEPSDNYSCDENSYFDNTVSKVYHKYSGYLWIQGAGKIHGRLFGGHTGLNELSGTPIEITAEDFRNKILFLEDLAEFLSPEQLADFVDWLGTIGALQMLNGMLIGKLCEYAAFDEHKNALLRIVKEKYNLVDLPIVANLNFGHTSPMCILPYGAMAEIDCDNQLFRILESGVV